MAPTDLTTIREPLGNICSVPDKIISVYALEQHIWADGNSLEAITSRTPELRTIEEFKIDPVRHFLNDIFRNMAAPYNPERKDSPIGQGYWVQAEFGSGKSHLLCFLAALALGNEEAWKMVQEKEQKEGRGKRESLAQFWDDGIKAKSKDGKGIFVVAKTLVGSGGGTIGYDETGRKLSEYILDAVKDQLQKETGKNISLYPVELLADRFLERDLERYYNDLQKFLRDPAYFNSEDEMWDINDLINDIQDNKSPLFKKNAGNVLWRFYDEYLDMRPNIEAETEDVLRHMVKTILDEGYTGVLLLIDEVSLFMKDRDDKRRAQDEKTLVVLSNRLAKVENLPIWTVCAAQQAIESRVAGVKNIIADDRLKLVPLLQEESDYYSIVLSRVRDIEKPDAIHGYYNYYRRGFTWPREIGESEFTQFFPFHKPAIEVLRDITHELTTARSAIHFMHQTLKHAIKSERKELIRLHDFFDEAMDYSEDPSGTNAGLAAIKSKRDREYKSYESAKQHIDGAPKGFLKVYHDRAVNILQTLFLYHIAKRKSAGLSGEDLANSILNEKTPDALVQENIEHYDILADALRKEIPQIREKKDEDAKSLFRFDPEQEGIQVRELFEKIRSEAEANEVMQKDAWEHLLALDAWDVRTRKMTYGLDHDIRSIFRDIVPNHIAWRDAGKKRGDQELEVLWQNKKTYGIIGMRDLHRIVAENKPLPLIESDENGHDFAVFVSSKPVDADLVMNYLIQHKDPRLIFWIPGELTQEERDRLITFAAYRRLVELWQGKESDDAIAVIDWVNDQLQTEMGTTARIVTDRYARGRMCSLDNSDMSFHMAGGLVNILTPIVDRVLNATYDSRTLGFEGTSIFAKEDVTKIINGIVKRGSIPKGTKLGKNENAVQNFGPGLKITTRDAKTLHIHDNSFITDIQQFIEEKLVDGTQTMPLTVIYKNFTGINGPNGKNYGLSPGILQIYLLCLAREGKIRINLGTRAQVPQQYIDYSTISSIEFNKNVLDNMIELQKMAKPENWDILRPYASKLLEEEIPATDDDMSITGYRDRLQALFVHERDKSAMVKQRADDLFTILETPNPYSQELDQIVALFEHDIAGNDIDLTLYALKDALGYLAFDDDRADPGEVDDLAIKFGKYHEIEKFLEYSTDLIAIHRYCTYAFTDRPELDDIRAKRDVIDQAMHDITPFISNDLRLRTELIGIGDTAIKATFRELVQDYTSLYMALHQNVLGQLEKYKGRLTALVQSDDMKILSTIEEINALKQKRSTEIRDLVKNSRDQIFFCPDSSHASIERELRAKPEHLCGLSFANYENYLQNADQCVEEVERTFQLAFKSALEFFINPSIQKRLEQGAGDPIIDGLLSCESVEDVQQYLRSMECDGSNFIDTVNRYLKQLVIKPVCISSFTPSIQTIEREHIADIVDEFREFLMRELESIEHDDDSLPMIQLE